MTKTTLVLALLAAAAGPVAGQQDERASTQRTASFDPAVDSVLSVSLLWGRIEVRPHERADVRFVVAEDRPVGELRSISGPVGFEIDQSAAGRVAFAASATPSGGFRALDVTVYAPVGVRLELTMERGGDIFVYSVGRELTITNRNGSVTLVDVRGATMVDARNGSIEASFLSLPEGAPLVLATLNGGVDVVLPSRTKADLHLVTPGDIRTDFPLDALPAATDENENPRQIRARLNGGGPRFYFQTHNGPITIRQGASE